MKEQGELVTLLNDLQLNNLQEDELIALSSTGGIDISGNNTSWKGCTNNCNGGNCASGCGA